MRDRRGRSALLLAVLLFAPWRPAKTQIVGANRPSMPSFVVPSAGDGTLRLHDFRGGLLVVSLWTSTCIPCVAELPALDSLAGGLDSTRVVVLALNADISMWEAERLLIDHPVRHMRVGFGQGLLRDELHVFGVPVTWVVDTAGGIAYSWMGFWGRSQVQEIRDQLTNELGEPVEPSP